MNAVQPNVTSNFYFLVHYYVIYEISAELLYLAGLTEVALFDLLVDNQLHQQPIPNEANLKQHKESLNFAR